MNIHLENVNLYSTSGPNHFANKLIKYLKKLDVSFNNKVEPHARLCFIESRHECSCAPTSNRAQFNEVPLVQRLDGIYFNSAQNYKLQNSNIKRTYNAASGVIFQSHFNKSLITKYFGEHKNSTVIHNGADVDHIKSLNPMQAPELDKYEKVWSCASSWRPHKRLQDNIEYFLEHSSQKECLVIAGHVDDKPIEDKRIYYVGNLNIDQLISLYKRSAYFIHLAWLDHCPNVVVDARASGCHIICSSSGGTREISGEDAIIIDEDSWDFEPVELYSPPSMNYSKKVKNSWQIDYNMYAVAEKYKKFLAKVQ